MKRLMLVLAFFVFAQSGASAENILDFSWNFGSVGLGLNYLDGDDDNIEFCVSVLNFTIEQKDINIGFEFSPAKYWLLFELQEKIDRKFSFINAYMYWDVIRNNTILLGPFVSINYLYVNILNGINKDEYIFSAGLRFSCKLRYIDDLNTYNAQIVSTEIGYRNISGSNKLYFSVNIDIILALIGIMSIYGDDS
jgi:hypothetical protein